MKLRSAPRHIRRLLACLALMLGAAGPAGAAEPRPFDSDSFARIREAGAGRPLVVAFWSTTCAPCAEELAILVRLHREHPGVRMVFVAADPPALREKVERFLSRFELGRIEVWQFGDEADERLRYSVDRSWRGEVPRAYFFTAARELTVQSGVLDEAQAADWLARAEAAAPSSK